MLFRGARYVLTKLFYNLMGLRIDHYRREVEFLWSLTEDQRTMQLDHLVALNRPCNAVGARVDDIEAVRRSPTLSKTLARDHAKSTEHRIGTFNRATAGTTGTPIKVSLNAGELSRFLAVRDYCFRHYGIKLGEREARLWGRPESGLKSIIKNFVMNRRVFHPVGHDSRAEVTRMVRWGPDYLYGYSSLLLDAARILEEINIEFIPPKLIVCTAESVLPAQKAYISRIFQAPVAEEYGSSEFDIIAFECRHGHRHLVNPWLILTYNEKGVLVSDVTRTSQNMICYELGDSLKLKASNCKILGSLEFVDKLYGRTTDRFFYLNSNDKIHVVEFAHIIEKYFREYGDSFSFLLRQKQYSELEIFFDSEPSVGFEKFKSYFHQEIRKIHSPGIILKVLILEPRSAYQKRNYFSQEITEVLDF